MNFTMMKKADKNFKYNLFEPSIHNTNGSTIILYHGWGTDADSYSSFAKDIAKKGFRVIVPEIIYHDTRNLLDNHFNKEKYRIIFGKRLLKVLKNSMSLRKN